MAEEPKPDDKMQRNKQFPCFKAVVKWIAAKQVKRLQVVRC